MINAKQIANVIEHVKATSESDAQAIDTLYKDYVRVLGRLSDVIESRDYYQRLYDMKVFTGV